MCVPYPVTTLIAPPVEITLSPLEIVIRPPAFKFPVPICTLMLPAVPLVDVSVRNTRDPELPSDETPVFTESSPLTPLLGEELVRTLNEPLVDCTPGPLVIEILPPETTSLFPLSITILPPLSSP